MEQAGDRAHAALARRAAGEWLGVARSLLGSAEAERRADAVDRGVTELETKLEGARALLEETVARRGRAAAELEQLQRAPPPPPAPAAARGKSGKETGRKSTGTAPKGTRE